MDINIGDKIGRLKVIEYDGYYKKEGTKEKRHYYKCLCDCGKEVVVNGKNLRSENIKSCGCIASEITVKRNKETKKHNKFYTIGETTFVKFTNKDKYFLCDTEDWDKLKQYAWHEDDEGYAKTNINNKIFPMHRLVMNCPEDMQVDHVYQVSRGVCDNRKKNLRITTALVNSRNCVKSKNNTSGYNGVYWLKNLKKWAARITYNYNTLYLGSFDNIEDAIKARKEAEKKYWGDLT